MGDDDYDYDRLEMMEAHEMYEDEVGRTMEKVRELVVADWASLNTRRRHAMFWEGAIDRRLEAALLAFGPDPLEPVNHLFAQPDGPRVTVIAKKSAMSGVTVYVVQAGQEQEPEP